MDQSSNHQFCPQCGTERADNASFCTGCGHQFNAADTNTPTQNQQPTATQKVTQEDGVDGKETLDFQDLHPNARWLFFFFYIKNTVILLLLLLGAGVVSIFTGDMLFMMIGFGGAGLYLIANIIAAQVAYKHYSFQVTETAFRKQFGILHIHTASIPFERIQNVNVRRTLVDRIIGLSHVDIETAGTSGEKKSPIIGGSKSSSEGHIPGVSPEEAEQVRSLIMRRAQEINQANANNL